MKFMRMIMDKTNEALANAIEMTKREMKKITNELSAKPGSGGWDRK